MCYIIYIYNATLIIAYLSLHGNVPFAPIPIPSHAAAIKFKFIFTNNSNFCSTCLIK